MPYRREWVTPELFVEHKGVRIYRAYEDDDIEYPWKVYFTTDKDAYERSSTTFNATSLPAWPEGVKDNCKDEELLNDACKKAIIAAIDAGMLVQNRQIRMPRKEATTCA